MPSPACSTVIATLVHTLRPRVDGADKERLVVVGAGRNRRVRECLEVIGVCGFRSAVKKTRSKKFTNS